MLWWVRYLKESVESHQLQCRFVYKRWGPWPSPSGKCSNFYSYQSGGRPLRGDWPLSSWLPLRHSTRAPLAMQRTDECRKHPAEPRNTVHKEHRISTCYSGRAHCVPWATWGIYTWLLTALSTVLGGGYYSPCINEVSAAQMIVLRSKPKI